MNKGCEFSLADSVEVIEEILCGGGEFRIYPRGTSMLPLIVQGVDSVVLRRRENGSVKKYEMVLYRRPNGQFVLHRVMKIQKDGLLTMCGDNQYGFERSVGADSVIGYVSLVYKNGKALRLDSLKYNLYLFFRIVLPFSRLFKKTKAYAARLFQKKR